MDAVSIIIIISSLIGAISAISIHLKSKCCGNDCDIDFGKDKPEELKSNLHNIELQEIKTELNNKVSLTH